MSDAEGFREGRCYPQGANLHRDLARTTFEHLRSINLSAELPFEPDWDAHVDDACHWQRQYELVKKQLSLCREQNLDNLCAGSRAPQPKDASSTREHISPERFYQAFPSQPPSPTVVQRRRTTIPRKRRLLKLLNRRRPAFSNGQAYEYSCAPSITPGSWPHDWWDIYKNRAIHLQEEVHGQGFYTDLGLEPDCGIPDLAYWQRSVRQLEQACLAEFFFHSNYANADADQSSDAATSVGASNVKLAPSRPGQSKSASLRRKEVEGPVSSRLRSRTRNTAWSSRLRSCGGTGQERSRGILPGLGGGRGGRGMVGRKVGG